MEVAASRGISVHRACLVGINVSYKIRNSAATPTPAGLGTHCSSLSSLSAIVSADPSCSFLSSFVSALSARLMASPAAARAADFTQVEAARLSLIAISQSVSEIGAPVVRPPNGGMEHGHDGGAEQRYRAKLISISNQSPDAQPAPCPPKNAAA